MTPSQMYTQMRYHLDVGSNFFPGDLCEQHLHTAQQEIVRLITQEDPSFFVAYADLTMVADQDTYAMPANARGGARVIFAEHGGDEDGEIEPSRLRDLLSMESGGLVTLTSTYTFSMQGDRVRVSPAPPTGTTSTVRVWYVPTFGNMLQGVATDGATSTLTLFSGNPNYLTNFGIPSLRTDYYVGMQIEMLSGSAAGDVRRITAYNGASRTVTVDSPWTSSASLAARFAINCPVPEDFHDMVPLRAAILGAPRNRNRQNELESLYGMSNRSGRMADLMAWVSRRHADHGRTVGYSDNGY